MSEPKKVNLSSLDPVLQEAFKALQYRLVELTLSQNEVRFMMEDQARIELGRAADRWFMFNEPTDSNARFLVDEVFLALSRAEQRRDAKNAS